MIMLVHFFFLLSKWKRHFFSCLVSASSKRGGCGGGRQDAIFHLVYSKAKKKKNQRTEGKYANMVTPSPPFSSSENFFPFPKPKVPLIRDAKNSPPPLSAQPNQHGQLTHAQTVASNLNPSHFKGEP